MFLCISFINMKWLRYVHIIFHDSLLTNFSNESSNYTSPLCLVKKCFLYYKVHLSLLDHQLHSLWNLGQPEAGSSAGQVSMTQGSAGQWSVNNAASDSILY